MLLAAAVFEVFGSILYVLDIKFGAMLLVGRGSDLGRVGLRA